MTSDAIAPASHAVPRATPPRSPASRSRATNGRPPAGLDGRSAEWRRFRDVVDDLTAEVTERAPGELTTAERLLVEAVARNVVEAERLAACAMRGEAVSSDNLTRLNNSVTRDLGRLRTGRAKTKAARQGVAAYIAAKRAGAVPA